MDRSDASFQAEKARVLGRADLSRKGSVDEPIRELIGFINQQESYYTSSSCSGRVVLFSEVGVSLYRCAHHILNYYDAEWQAKEKALQLVAGVT